MILRITAVLMGCAVCLSCFLLSACYPAAIVVACNHGPRGWMDVIGEICWTVAYTVNSIVTAQSKSATSCTTRPELELYRYLFFLNLHGPRISTYPPKLEQQDGFENNTWKYIQVELYVCVGKIHN